MSRTNKPCRRTLGSATFLLLTWLSCAFGRAADFSVTSPGSFYSFNGSGQNPTITLIRGRTYTFALSTAGSHPFRIATSASNGAPAPAGVTGNNNSSSGTITFAVPINAPNCSYYCTVHFFGGTIQMIDPPTPPVVNLLSLTVSSNLVLKTAQVTTNGFTFIPEATTNLTETNWFALTVNSNRFANGTNEIFCGKPDATNAFFRIRIQ
jgi:hypothetical protein